MADLTQKLPENVAGQFYVDATCIDCDLCRETAPGNFRCNDAKGHSYVHHQPQDPAQQAACLAALENALSRPSATMHPKRAQKKDLDHLSDQHVRGGCQLNSAGLDPRSSAHR